MGEPKYTGFGSRIVLDKRKPVAGRGKIGRKEDSQDKAIKPPWDVDMRFFTLKVNPAGDAEDVLGDFFGRGCAEESRPSPTDTASDESFHSCRSSASQWGRRPPRPPPRDADQESNPFRVTMVNAVIINNAVSQYARGDEGHRKSPRTTSGTKPLERRAEDVSRDAGHQRKSAYQPGPRYQRAADVAEGDPKCQRHVEDVVENFCGGPSQRESVYQRSDSKRQSFAGDTPGNFSGALKCERAVEEVADSVGVESSNQWKSVNQHSCAKRQSFAEDTTGRVSGAAKCQRCVEESQRTTDLRREATCPQSSPEGPKKAGSVGNVCGGAAVDGSSARFTDSSYQRAPTAGSMFSTTQHPISRSLRRVDSVTSFSSGDSGSGAGKRANSVDPTKQNMKGLEIMPKARQCAVPSGGGRSMEVSDRNDPRSKTIVRKQEVPVSESVRYVKTFYLKQSFLEKLPKMELVRPMSELSDQGQVELQSRDCSDVAETDLFRPLRLANCNNLALANRRSTGAANLGRGKSLKRLEKVDKRLLVNNFSTRAVSSKSSHVVIHPWAQEVMQEETELFTAPRTLPRHRNADGIAVEHELDTGLELTRAGSSIDLGLMSALEFASPLHNPRDLPVGDLRITLDEGTDIVYMKESLAAGWKRKRRARRSLSPLPVIREESFESVESDSSDVSEESNASTDYCLEDNSGRAIHLFDARGLPLTDAFGRPLRGADGRTLMACDAQGMPLADAASGVFDRLGRHALDPDFAPWDAAPSPPTLRLLAPSGRPLLLFDSRGRPLTAADGALLNDRTGVRLMTLNCGRRASKL